MPKVDPITEAIGFNVYLTADEANTISYALWEKIEEHENEKKKLDKDDEYYYEDIEMINRSIKELKDIALAIEEAWDRGRQE
jgi:hypothetical protein